MAAYRAAMVAHPPLWCCDEVGVLPVLIRHSLYIWADLYLSADVDIGHLASLHVGW